MIVIVIISHCNGIKWDRVLFGLVHRENIRTKSNQKNLTVKGSKRILDCFEPFEGKEGSKGVKDIIVILTWCPWTFVNSALLGVDLDMGVYDLCLKRHLHYKKRYIKII